MERSPRREPADDHADEPRDPAPSASTPRRRGLPPFDLVDGLRLVLGIIAAAALVSAGAQMSAITTVEGDTLAEVFYRRFGLFSMGLGIGVLALCLPRGRR